MGYAIHCAAMKGGNLQAMYPVLGLRPTGEQEEIPESGIVCAELPTGWNLVLFNRDTIKDQYLRQKLTGFELEGEIPGVLFQVLERNKDVQKEFGGGFLKRFFRKKG